MFGLPKTRKPLWPFVLNEASDLANGLVVYVPMAIPGAPTLFDMSIPGKRLAQKFPLSGGASYATGPDGGPCCSFLAASSQFANYAGVPVSAAPLTMSAWINTKDATTNGRIVDIDNSVATSDYLSLQTNAADIAFQHRVSASNSTITYSGGVVAGKWRHILGDVDSTGAMTLFVDGISRASGAGNGTVLIGANVLAIGRRNTSALDQYANSLIAEVCLWNRVLTLEEKFALFNPQTRWQLRYNLGDTKWFIGSGSSAVTRGVPVLRGGILQSPIIQGAGNSGGIVA